MKLKDLQETASAGATGAGSIAISTAVPNEKVVSADANDVGMFPIVRRNPKKKIKGKLDEAGLSFWDVFKKMKEKGMHINPETLRRAAKLARMKNLRLTRSDIKKLSQFDEASLDVFSGEVYMVINNEDALNLILQKVGDKIQRHENNIIVVDQDRADKIENFLHIKGYDKGEDYMVMQKEQNINEGVLDSVDDEGVLVKAQLYSLAKRAIELHQMITDTEEIEGWVQSHIAVANDNINSVYQYMDYESQTLEEPAPEIEGVDVVDELPPVEMESVDPVITKKWNKIVTNATKELESA